jgi:hypothetical protein
MKRLHGMVSETCLVVAARDQVSSDLADEAVILNLKSGVYYGLNSVGARIWNLVQHPKTIHEIRDVLVDEYDVDPDLCKRDLQTLLQDLEAAGLVQIEHETTA